jgi:hypothetical protein
VHVAQQLHCEAFAVEISGRSVEPAEVFANWSRLDRFGIVVTQPLGALGACLLLQLATTLFYEADPARRGPCPTYPEIYVFHVGGPHGDLSYFDFWPPRKEVRMPDGDPLAVLEAINAHGITRLAIPSATPGDAASLAAGPSTWAEQASARDRLATTYVYASDGRVADGDLVVSAVGSVPLENVLDTLDPFSRAHCLRDRLDRGESVVLPGPSVDDDGKRWVEKVILRGEEMASPEAEAAARMHRTRTARMPYTEIYRRIATDEALAILAATRTGRG